MKPRTYNDLQTNKFEQYKPRNLEQSKYQRIKWDQESSQKLLETVKNMKPPLNWEQISVLFGNRHPWSCYNKYIEMTDPKWTTIEENQLGLLWEKNRSRPGFNISEADKIFKRHKPKAIKFKLEQLTRWGRFKPRFWIDKNDLEKIEQ